MSSKVLFVLVSVVLMAACGRSGDTASNDQYNLLMREHNDKLQELATANENTRQSDALLLQNTIEMKTLNAVANKISAKLEAIEKRFGHFSSLVAFKADLDELHAMVDEGLASLLQIEELTSKKNVERVDSNANVVIAAGARQGYKDFATATQTGGLDGMRKLFIDQYTSLARRAELESPVQAITKETK